MKTKIITSVFTFFILSSLICHGQNSNSSSTSALLIAQAASISVNADKIDCDSLVSDVRQLAEMIESIHPDPYTNCGGKVAFHRRLQSILEAIPAQGMTRADFYRLLRPFVTMIGDAHTWL